MYKSIILIAILAVMFAACNNKENTQSADRIYINAKIWTGLSDTSFAEAIAIKDDKIVFVGSDYTSFKGSSTEVIDLQGKLMVPGFTDNHTHFISGGYNLGSVNLRNAKTKNEFIQLIKEYAAKLPGDRWITGGNWDHENWGGDLPTKEMIDSVSNNHPIFINRLDGHMGLANSIALQKAGITKNTATPAGGAMVKDKSGEPTGILKDAAQDLINKVMPPLSEAELDEALLRAQDYALSLGVTQVHDMVSYDGFTDIATWQRVKEKNKLMMRAYQFVPLRLWARLDSFIKKNGRGDDMVRWGGVKGYADGSLGSGTAWLYKPYLDDHTTSGLMVSDTGWLRKSIVQADAAGLQIAIHAIGDKANDFIEIYFAEATEKNGKRDRRFRIEHAQHLSQKGIAGFAQLGIVPSMQAIHLADDGKWAAKRIDADLISRTYAFRNLLDSKANLTLGSDWDVASLNPLEGIGAAVTRQTSDGKNNAGWVAAQKISLPEALRCYTANNAFAGFQENKLGQLKPGMLADFVILSENIFAIAPEKIKEVKVLRTIVNGKEVYIRK
jgi:predicted amidohydrolase YtcJ